MNTNIFRRGIDEYIHRDNTDYAILVTGDWGSGKSYYLCNTIADEYNRNDGDEDVFYTVLTASAAGLSSSDQFLSLLFEKIKSNRVLSVLSRSSSFFSTQKDANISLVASIISSFTNMFQSRRIRKELEKTKKKIILIIDDIERYKGELDELFAAVQNTFIEKHTHVIYVAYEDDLLENEYYRKYKEKYIRYTLHFDILDEDMIRHVAEGADNDRGAFSLLLKEQDNASLIVLWMKKTDIINLRTFIIAVNCYNHFASVCPILDNNQSLYLFFSALTHAAFVKSGSDDGDEDAFASFKKEYNLRSDNLGYLPRFYASYGDFENIEFSPLILSYIKNGYCDPEDIREYIRKDYGLLSEELVALSHLGHYSQQSENQVRVDTHTLISSIKEKKLPYSELVNAAKALSGVEDELLDESYRETIVNAIEDKSYPGRDEYFRDVKLERDTDKTSFSYHVYELLKAQKEDHDRESERKELMKLFSLAASDANYIVQDPRFKGSRLFERICTHDLVRQFRNLDDRGLYRVAEVNINDIASSPDPLTPSTIDALGKIRDELIMETDEGGNMNNKTNRFRKTLASQIDDIIMKAGQLK